MKIIISLSILMRYALGVLLMLSANISFAQIFTETFNYTPDSINGLAGQSSGVWARLNSGDSILVTGGNLDYPGLVASTGNKITYGGTGSDNYRTFANQTSGTVYASFLINVSSVTGVSATGGYTIGFVENGTTSTYGGCLWIRNNVSAGTTQFNLGVSGRTNTAATFASNVLEINTTYLIVVSYQIVAGTTNDIVKLWINPVSLGAVEKPASLITVTNSGVDITGIQKIIIRQDAAATTPLLSIDEMRVGTSWADVTPGTSGTPTVTTDLTGYNGSFAGILTGSSSSSSSYTVNGTNLTGNIVIHPPSGFEIRTSVNAFSASDIILAPTSGTVYPTTIDVRCTPISDGTISGTITNSSTGAPTQNVQVYGSGLTAEPTVQTSNITFASITSNSFTINFTSGNGSNRLVIIKSGSAVNTSPIDGEVYTASGVFGNGTQIGTGNYVVYNGTGNSVSISNLNESTIYYIAVYEYNVTTAGSENYNLTSPPVNNQLTSTAIPSVVINKYQNAVPDGIELLVVQDNLDMRGMIIKDFSGNMSADGGGKFQFSSNNIWSSVRSGTIIILRNNATATDSVTSGFDYIIDLGLNNTNFFTNLGGAFDIATTDMLMIKAAGSGASGVNGSIHILASGTAGTFFTSAPVPKLITASTTPSNNFAYANNSTSSLSDYNGTDVTGGAIGLAFGTGNTPENIAYITSLRNVVITGNATLAGGTYNSLTVNSSGAVVTLADNININGTLTLTEGIIELGAFNLTVNATSEGNASSYIRTNGSGVLTINNVGAASVVFPIGNTSFNPFIISNAGTPDNFTGSVQNTIDHPTVDNTQYVQRQWNISESVAEGSIAAVTFRWALGDEGSSVNRGAMIIEHYTNGAYMGLGSSAVTGSDTALLISSVEPVTSFSPFIIGNQAIAPVVLSSFNLSVISNTVNLNWSTVSELNNSGFDIERKIANSDWIRIGSVAGNGTSKVSHNYSFSDRNLASGNYNYRIKQIDFNGNFEYFNLSNEVIIGAPVRFALNQNYPNPFNPYTLINYELAKDSFVILKIYDLSGKEVADLVNTMKTAGYYSINFDASKLSSGLYFYTLKTNEFVSTRKMLLIK